MSISKTSKVNDLFTARPVGDGGGPDFAGRKVEGPSRSRTHDATPPFQLSPFQGTSLNIKTEEVVFLPAPKGSRSTLHLGIKVVDSNSNNRWNGNPALALGIIRDPILKLGTRVLKGAVFSHDGRYVLSFNNNGDSPPLLLGLDPAVSIDRDGNAVLKPKILSKQPKGLVKCDLKNLPPRLYPALLHGLMPDNKHIRGIILQLIGRFYLMDPITLQTDVDRILRLAATYPPSGQANRRAQCLQEIRKIYGQLSKKFHFDDSGSTRLEYSLGPLDTEVRQGRAIGGSVAMFGGSLLKAWQKSQEDGGSFFVTLGQTLGADFVRLQANLIGEETLVGISKIFLKTAPNILARFSLGGVASFGINSFTGETKFSPISFFRHVLIDGLMFGGVNAGLENLAFRFLGKSFSTGIAASLLGVGAATFAAHELGQVWENYFEPEKPHDPQQQIPVSKPENNSSELKLVS